MQSATASTHHLDQLQALYQAGFANPFLDQALQKLVEHQATRDENDLAQVNRQLAKFEEEFGLTSANFWQRYQAGQMADSADFMEWNILCKMRQRILARLQIIQNDHAQ